MEEKKEGQADSPAESSSLDAQEERSTEPEFERQIADLTREKDEFRDLLQRKQAEFENFRRRVVKEKSTIRSSAQIEVLASFLSVLDAGEAGLTSLADQGDDPALKAYLEGYQLLLKEIQRVLEQFGVCEIQSIGRPFDPNFQEAVMREESADHEDGEVIEQFRKGYRLNDVLLRPAQVKVAIQPPEEEPEDGEEDQDESSSKVDIQA